MKLKKKSKAFTLTELLVVVVVIGVLSAVVLPKYSKVIETRRTTEAEELMGAIRTEQEKRCALDKEYLMKFDGLKDIVKNPDTKNYKLALASTGINATRNDKYSYTLEMPSYADGRICCSGADCEKLNKNYPACDELTNKSKTPDYQESPESCKADPILVGGVFPPPSISCVGDVFQACGCQKKGLQMRTCDTSTGTWSDWGACSISDECECTGTAPDARQRCNKCGEQTRRVTCNKSTGNWETDPWSACNKTEAECEPEPEPEPTPECTNGDVRGEARCNFCGTRTTEKCVDGKWIAFEGECSKTLEACLAECTEGETQEVEYRFECQHQTKKQECIGGQWVDKEEGNLLWNNGAECVTGEQSTTGGNMCPSDSPTCFHSSSSGNLTQTGVNENGGVSSSKPCDSGRICKDCKWVKVRCDGSNIGSSSGGGGGGAICGYRYLQRYKSNDDPNLTATQAADVVRMICVFGSACYWDFPWGRQRLAAGQEVCYESPVL